MANFTNKRRFNKTNIKRMPEDKPIIYKINNNQGKNIYTGIAKKGESQNRLLAHLTTKKDKIPGGTKFQYSQVKNKETAEKIEKQIIKKEQPKFNIQNK